MDFNAGEDLLLIWSDSSEIYEINADGQSKAHEHAESSGWRLGRS